MDMANEGLHMQKVVPCQSLMAPTTTQTPVVQVQKQVDTYTANYLQGPPPLIPDKNKVIIIKNPAPPAPATPPAAVTLTNKPSSKTPTSTVNNLAGIPGVYFGYQIQEEQLQNEQLTTPTTSQELHAVSITEHANESPKQVEAVTVKQEKISPKVLSIIQSPVTAELQGPPLPPALIPTPNSQGTTTTPKSENSYLTQQILKSTSTLFNFIQLQVLSSINKKTNVNDNMTKIDSGLISKDGFRTVSNFSLTSPSNNHKTGFKSQSLTSYQQNFLHDLNIASSPITYTTHTNSSSPTTHISQPLPTIEMHNPYTAVMGGDLFSDAKKKRQKKTREEKLAYLRKYARDRRARETPEQREARLADLRARQRARKANETPEQRQVRLEKDRLKTGRYRAKKRQDEIERPRTLFGANIVASGPFILSD